MGASPLEPYTPLAGFNQCAAVVAFANFGCWRKPARARQGEMPRYPPYLFSYRCIGAFLTNIPLTVGRKAAI